MPKGTPLLWSSIKLKFPMLRTQLEASTATHEAEAKREMMNEAPREPSTAWWFDRTNAVQIVIGALLMLVLAGAASVYIPYHREQQIARKIESIGGEVGNNFIGPNWILMDVQERLPFLKRMTSISFYETQVTDADLGDLKGLTRLFWLDLNRTQVTDDGLEHLKGLTSLKVLTLSGTQITDAGLEHLKGLSNLRTLSLVNTQTTIDGRASLRKALPKCKIIPDW